MPTDSAAPHVPRRRSMRTRLRLLEGILPLQRKSLPAELFAGLTLAALGIPEVLGYAKIAGMPVVTGLFTMVLPVLVYALVCSSRHLVVGADSATAAILAASLTTFAKPGSDRYIALSMACALLTGACLLAARAVRLGFIANFLSRTVLVGFLTGVGISVACGQLPDMLGVHVHGDGTLAKLWALAHALGDVQAETAWVSAAVVVVMLLARALSRRVPMALLVVIAAIVLSHRLDFAARGIALLGPVPAGLPTLHWPALTLADCYLVLKPVLSMVVVILAQSSATARAYAAKYDETVDDDLDLVALGLANAAAAVTGAFVVNGSPTKTQIVDDAGGRSQLAQLVTASVVVAVLLFLAAPLAALPLAVLASIVFLIGVELVDLRGLHAILRVRRHEFVVAVLTCVAVVVLGVEQGIILAILACIIDHLRHSYAPHNGVLVREGQHLRLLPPTASARIAPGVLMFRFGSSLYYANSHNLYEEVLALLDAGEPPRCLALDCVAIGDVDYSASSTLERLVHQLARRHVRLLFVQVTPKVQSQLDKYGITQLVGRDAIFDGADDLLAVYGNA